MSTTAERFPKAPLISQWVRGLVLLLSLGFVGAIASLPVLLLDGFVTWVLSAFFAESSDDLPVVFELVVVVFGVVTVPVLGYRVVYVFWPQFKPWFQQDTEREDAP